MSGFFFIKKFALFPDVFVNSLEYCRSKSFSLHRFFFVLVILSIRINPKLFLILSQNDGIVKLPAFDDFFIHYFLFVNVEEPVNIRDFFLFNFFEDKSNNRGINLCSQYLKLKPPACSSVK